MNSEIAYGNIIIDSDWGCNHLEITNNPHVDTIKLCLVKVEDIYKIASELTKQVQNTSWIMKLDKTAQRSYSRTVEETAQKLVEIFNMASSSANVAKQFGELMVSMGSARALEILFDHTVLPIAELWKPQIKQNEGFDFHTICPNEMINFGEAKFSSNDSPHGRAISQACDFIDNEKHLRDGIHLQKLTNESAMENLNNDDFGIVAAFSINAENPITVFKNALESALKVCPSKDIKAVYIIGVIH